MPEQCALLAPEPSLLLLNTAFYDRSLFGRPGIRKPLVKQFPGFILPLYLLFWTLAMRGSCGDRAQCAILGLWSSAREQSGKHPHPLLTGPGEARAYALLAPSMNSHCHCKRRSGEKKEAGKSKYWGEGLRIGNVAPFRVPHAVSISYFEEYFVVFQRRGNFIWESAHLKWLQVRRQVE